MKTWVKVAIGIGVATAVVTGVGVAEHYAHAASSKVPAQLLQGHRYKVTIAETGAFSPSPTIAAVQAELDAAAPGAFHVVQVDVLDANSGTLILDWLGATTATSQLAGVLPDKGTVTVTDMGPTPAGG